MVDAVWESSDMISCLSPSMPPGNINIYLHYQSQRLSQSFITFRFVVMSTVFKISPDKGSLLGGDEVYVFVNNLFFGESIKNINCYFAYLREHAY